MKTTKKAKAISVNAAKAQDIMQGNLLGVELFQSSFGRVATLPKQYMTADKTVSIPFFPAAGGQISSRLGGAVQALENLSIKVGNSTYIKISDYEKANETINKYVESIDNLVADKIIPHLADLKSDYVARAKKALELEGVEGEELEKATKRMAAKFPTRFDVDMHLNVYSFPTPAAIPAGVSGDVAKLLADGNNQKILSVWNAVVHDTYQALYDAAVAVANSMERNSGKVGSRTIGMVNTASSKAKSFVNELGTGMAIGATEQAIEAFDRLFKNQIDSITPTTARWFAALAYKEAKNLGASEGISLEDIGMDEETIAELDTDFADLG